MSETATRVLVVMVIVGAVVIVLATGVLAFLLWQRHSSAEAARTTLAAPVPGPVVATGAAPDLAAALPAGARATSLTLGGDRVGLLYERAGGGQGAVVIGLDGRVILRLDPLAP